MRMWLRDICGILIVVGILYERVLERIIED